MKQLFIKNRYAALMGLGIVLLLVLVPEIAMCDVEQTLSNIQLKLINGILPLLSVIGIVIAGFSFISGNPNGRSHLVMAAFGILIGFGAPGIMRFLKGLVQ